jgi:hypothetical protein
MKIGPTFPLDLKEAGVAGLPFSWDLDGLVDISQLTPEQLKAVNAVLAVHDPNKTIAPPVDLLTRIEKLEARVAVLERK